MAWFIIKIFASSFFSEVKRNHKSLKSLLNTDDDEYKVGMMPVPMHGTSGMFDTPKPWSPHEKTSIKDSKSKGSTKKGSSKSKTESTNRSGTSSEEWL